LRVYLGGNGMTVQLGQEQFGLGLFFTMGMRFGEIIVLDSPRTWDDADYDG
jgi:hypothetical protein